MHHQNTETSLSIELQQKTIRYSIDFFPENTFTKLKNALKKQINNRKHLFVTDENIVSKTDFFTEDLSNCIVLPAGEENKTWENIEKIIDTCFEHDLDRSSVLIAVGGGVIGDMTGFASSIFMRGIPFIQVPTTLLSMVDSSVGGKTGIDTKHGKNLIGTFHQPERVLCCKHFLSTLEFIEIQNGLSEMIKHGILGSPTHFKHLEDVVYTCSDKTLLSQKIFSLVPESITVKKHIIEQDETEQFGGVRGFLNLGHTYGHAIELLSHFQVPHGIGVAKGIICALETSKHRNLFTNEEEENRIKNIFTAVQIDTNHPFSDTEIQHAMKHDKKKKDGKIRLVLIKRIGEVQYDTL